MITPAYRQPKNAVTKIANEHYAHVFAMHYGMEIIGLRYFNVFGPRQNPESMYSGVISRFIDALMTGDEPVIFGDGEQSRDFTYIANVVNANIMAAQAVTGMGETMNVANGDRITLNELLNVLRSITGRSDVVPRYEAPRKGDVKHSQADNRRAVECLDYKELVGLEDGLKKTIDWWKTSRFNK